MKSLSFDDLVRLYDETRTFDGPNFDAALDYLTETFPPRSFNKVFEPGIGTGRIAVPLAARGYQVTGVDISGEMLKRLQEQLERSNESLDITYQIADVTNLPFPAETFDMAIAVHLFYFIQDWRKAADEILRVVRRDGPVVLLHTGTGTEIPLLNERYKELCGEQGFAIRETGVKSTGEVVDYFIKSGFRAETVRDRWKWISSIRLDKAIGYIRRRAYSFTTAVPDDVHTMAIEKLESEMFDRFGGPASVLEVPNQIYLVLVSRELQTLSEARKPRAE